MVFMKKTEALNRGYCKRCTAYGPTWRCGVVNQDTVNCQLPPDVQERWRGEWGLMGETQRHEKPQFGDELPPRRTIKKKRKFS